MATGPAATGSARGGVRPAGARPRIAYLSYSSGAFDARTARMARSAVEAGYEVVVYARLQDGLPAVEERDGYRVVRAPWQWWRAIPGVRSVVPRLLILGGRSRTDGPAAPASHPGGRGTAVKARVLRAAGPFGTALRAVFMFPVMPLAWAHGLEDAAEPADIWHGMWAGSLPASARLARRHGGRTIYDSRDVYMESRLFAATFSPLRTVLARIERRWARRMDRVLTVNEAYADLVARQLRVPRPPVVMNCPARWRPGDPPPDRIRAALGLAGDTAIVLYQGQLLPDRGIEQAMDAVLEVPGAVLVLLGFGPLRPDLEARAAVPPYLGRVFLLPPVPPDELVAWTASADVSVMPIAPTSLNHRHTTPQKLFESLAAGVPVVASDLPGMAEVVGGSGVGRLCDPGSPPSIAAAIRGLLEASPADRAALRARILAIAHERYAWEAQVDVLLELYRGLLGQAAPARDLPVPSVPAT